MKLRPAALLVLPLFATAVALPLEEPPQPQGPHKPPVAVAEGDSGHGGPPEIPRKPDAVVLAEIPPGDQGPEKPPKKPNAHGPNAQEVPAASLLT